MSEEILKALTQLFAIITKQDGGVTPKEKDFIELFFKQRLSKNAVEEYLSLYESFLVEKKRRRTKAKPEQEESPEQQASEEADESVPLYPGARCGHGGGQHEEHERRGLHAEGHHRGGQEGRPGNDPNHRLNLNA